MTSTEEAALTSRRLDAIEGNLAIASANGERASGCVVPGDGPAGVLGANAGSSAKGGVDAIDVPKTNSQHTQGAARNGVGTWDEARSNTHLSQTSKVFNFNTNQWHTINIHAQYYFAALLF